MVVVADETPEDLVREFYRRTLQPRRICRQNKMVVVAGFANAYATIFEPVDDNSVPKTVIFGKDATASQIYHAVSRLCDECPSPETFQLILMYGDKKYPLKFENKPIAGLDWEPSPDVIIFARISVIRNSDAKNGENINKVDEDAVSGTAETSAENSTNEDGIIEFQVVDITVPNAATVLSSAFLTSPTTTVRELYENIVYLYAHNSPPSAIQLQYLRHSGFGDIVKILSSDEYFDKTLEEAGFNFKKQNQTLKLELIDAAKQPESTVKFQEEPATGIFFSPEQTSRVSSRKLAMHMPSEALVVEEEAFVAKPEAIVVKRKALVAKPEPETEAKPEMVYVGLVNQAMTCYLNSLLQALYMTPEFRNALYNWEYVDGSEKDEANSIPYQLQKLFLNLQTSTKTAVETTSLTKSFGWDSTEAWQQHDIQELCRVMFDALEQKFKNTQQADLINRLYEGKMIDYVKCLECSTEKSREDTFLDIPLPVKPFGSNVAYNSVEEALRAFVQPETLDGVNQYFCETCNKKCDAHKGLKFTKFPYLLTLHLKRFDFDYNTFHRIKLNDKVTFPDILNLNSFIPSSSQESPTTEEDAGVGVKCDDSSTTDSGNLDECLPCGISENGITSDHIINHEQDDDEGIDMSNGPSTSSTEHSQDDSRHRAASGPYQYELFSIMIHSGSASGGHYYAYIKDFRTKEWLCFNDQNVTPITYDDIQKTYGGGPTRGYYSGAYSTSTNAYMLMYRQIDAERNILPMEVDNFPKHIQELLVKMKESEEEKKIYLRTSPMYKMKVHLHHPVENVLKSRRLFSVPDATMADMVERAYKAFDLDEIVELEQCRLVIYNPSSDTIESTFDGREQESLGDLLQRWHPNMLLEIRKKDEEFERYLPGGLGTRVFLLDYIKKEVIDGPIYVRAIRTKTVMEYKKQVSEVTNIDPKHMLMALQQFPTGIKSIENNDNQLENEGFTCGCRIFVTNIKDVSKEQLKNVVEPALIAIVDNFESIISLYAELPDTSPEVLDELNIPSLESRQRDLTDHKDHKDADKVSVDNQRKKPEVGEGSQLKDDQVVRDQPSSWSAEPLSVCDNKEWQEQSNSEDSSLSDSDRTLVGDASEDDDFGLAGVDDEWYPHRHSDNKQDNWELDQDETQADYFFKATPYTKDDKKYLRLLVDKRIKFGTFKKHLEPYVGVPTECFKVLRQAPDSTDVDYTRLTNPLIIWDDGEKITITLGRALRINEFRMRVHQLNDITNGIPYTFLFEWTVSKDATVGAVKKQLLAELKRKHNYEIPFERCRLRKKNYQIPSKVLLNDQKIRDVGLQSQCEIIIQELTEDDPVTNTHQILVMVRRALTYAKIFGPVQEVVLETKSYTELGEKISELSEIPVENLQLTKGKWPCDLYSTRRHWTPAKEIPWPHIYLKNGAIFFYRDCSEKLHVNTPEEIEAADFRAQTQIKNPQLINRTRISNYADSPRRERALKIYLDDK